MQGGHKGLLYIDSCQNSSFSPKGHTFLDKYELPVVFVEDRPYKCSQQPEIKELCHFFMVCLSALQGPRCCHHTEQFYSFIKSGYKMSRGHAKYVEVRTNRNAAKFLSMPET